MNILFLVFVFITISPDVVVELGLCYNLFVTIIFNFIEIVMFHNLNDNCVVNTNTSNSNTAGSMSEYACCTRESKGVINLQVQPRIWTMRKDKDNL